MNDVNMLDFNSALLALDEASNSFTVDVWIPSLQENLTFKQLDAKQQKHLLSAAMDTSVYNTSFIKTFYDILKNNILNNSFDINNLTLVDKICIGLTLKSQISDEIVVFFGEKNKISNKFKIKPILDKFKTYKLPDPIIVESKNETFLIKTELLYPTVKVEFDYDNQLKGNKKPEDVKTTEDVQKIISEAFIGETSKYIKTIWINDNEINLFDLNFDKRTKIIEKLPSNLIQKIIDVVGIWKKDIDNILSVTHEEYTQTITIDSFMFLN